MTSDPINVVIGWQVGEKKVELSAAARATRSSMEKLKLNFANFGWCHSLSMYSMRRTVHTILGVNVKPWLKIKVLVTKAMMPC